MKTRKELIWKDKKRYLGKPISFTVYGLSEDRLYIEYGILNKVYLEYKLYKAKDIFVKQTIWQRIFDMGDIHISMDGNVDVVLSNVSMPKEIMDMISYYSESRREKRVRNIETVRVDDNDDDEVGGI